MTISTSWGWWRFGGTNSGRVSWRGEVRRHLNVVSRYNVWGGRSPENSATFRKVYGILSVDGILYMWIMVEVPTTIPNNLVE
jgi:hypothetical protein